MAVAALSTSALALTATPAAPPPANAAPDAPQSFAKLVAQTQPEGRAAKGDARPQTDAKPGEEASSEEAAATTAEEKLPESAPEQPVDILAEIQAMVVAASQLGSGQPVTPIVQPAQTVSSVDVAEVVATPATPTPTPQAAAVLPAPVPTDGTVIPLPGALDVPAAAQQSTPELTQIAGMIAALRQAFGKEERAVPREAPAAAPLPPAAEVEVEVEAKTVTLAPQLTVQQPVTEQEEAPVVLADAEDVEQVASPDKAQPRNRVAHLIAAALAKAAPATQRSEPVIIQPAAPEHKPTPVAIDDAAAEAAAPTSDDGSTAATPTVAAPMPSTPTVTAAPTAASMTATQAPASADAAVVQEGHGIDQTIDRHLDLARDQQWLDRLARDISQAATQPGQMKFHLNPQNLGALTVEIANTAVGTSIRMTTDTEQARTILADAQPRLIAEVRAQGLRIAEAHVDLNNQQSSGGSGSAGAGSAFSQQQQQGQQHPASEIPKPFARTESSIRDDAGDSASGDDRELYA